MPVEKRGQPLLCPGNSFHDIGSCTDIKENLYYTGIEKKRLWEKNL
jgi:hypothetical protein